jgi:hypothetical protein
MEQFYMSKQRTHKILEIKDLVTQNVDLSGTPVKLSLSDLKDDVFAGIADSEMNLLNKLVEFVDAHDILKYLDIGVVYEHTQIPGEYFGDKLSGISFGTQFNQNGCPRRDLSVLSAVIRVYCSTKQKKLIVCIPFNFVKRLSGDEADWKPLLKSINQANFELVNTRPRDTGEETQNFLLELSSQDTLIKVQYMLEVFSQYFKYDTGLKNKLNKGLPSLRFIKLQRTK